eukprot:5003527-Pleurochrysis_carterae.AAC.2
MQSRAAERFSHMSDERKKTLELTVKDSARQITQNPRMRSHCCSLIESSRDMASNLPGSLGVSLGVCLRSAQHSFRPSDSSSTHH